MLLRGFHHRLLLLLLMALVATACTMNYSDDSPATQIFEELEPTATEPIPTVSHVSCDVLITNAMDQVGSTCDHLNRNQACYGNELVQVDFREDLDAEFKTSGDIVELANISRLYTSALDMDNNYWGIAVIKAQANLPDTLPGQNVTFILFGDVEMESPSPDMRAVTISTGIGEVTCNGAPPPAIMIQSPNGHEIAMNINGAEITLGSTAWITAEDNQDMQVGILEGQGVITAFGVSRTVIPGSAVNLPLGENNVVSGPPSELIPFDLSMVANLPVNLLERKITIPEPMTTPPTPTPSATPTLTRTPRPTITPTVACVPNAQWTGTYTIQANDTLGNIATRHNVTLQALQTANCITDANAIVIGQSLRVPAPSPTPTASGPVTDPDLRANKNTINAGECVTIEWNKLDAQEVYFEGQPANDNYNRHVCPQRTSTFTLVAVFDADTRESYTLTIEVIEPPTSTATETATLTSTPSPTFTPTGPALQMYESEGETSLSIDPDDIP